MYGIKETREFFTLIDEVIGGIEKAKAGDGKVDFPNDLVHFFNVPVSLFTAIVGADQVPKELADLDDAEVLQLTTDFGNIIDNGNFRNMFFHLVSFAQAVKAEVQDRKEETEEA